MLIRAVLVTALAVVVAFTGCSRFRSPFRREDGRYTYHRIRRQGETLGVIAEEYTGTSDRSHEIASHNPELRPRALKVGQIVRIPLSLASRRGAVPREAHASSANGNAGPGVSAASGPADSLPASGTAPADPAGIEQDLTSEVFQAELYRDHLEDAVLERAAEIRVRSTSVRHR